MVSCQALRRIPGQNRHGIFGRSGEWKPEEGDGNRRKYTQETPGSNGTTTGSVVYFIWRRGRDGSTITLNLFPCKWHRRNRSLVVHSYFSQKSSSPTECIRAVLTGKGSRWMRVGEKPQEHRAQSHTAKQERASAKIAQQKKKKRFREPQDTQDYCRFDHGGESSSSTESTGPTNFSSARLVYVASKHHMTRTN